MPPPGSTTSLYSQLPAPALSFLPRRPPRTNVGPVHASAAGGRRRKAADSGATTREPWMLSDEDVQRQKEELEAYMAQRLKQGSDTTSRRTARKIAGRGALEGDTRHREMHAKVYGEAAVSTNARPDPGRLGNGEPQWWALWVSERKEKPLCEWLAGEVRGLGPLTDPETGEARPRTIETWVPSKMIKAWNLSTKKMGKKTVKYGGGGWLFFKAVLDEKLDKKIQEMPVIKGYHFTVTWVNTLTTDPRAERRRDTIPEPCSDDFMQSVHDWVQLNEDEDEEEVKARLYGVTGGAIEGESERIDEDLRYVDEYEAEGGRVNERTGGAQRLRRYKSDAYSGTYSNPSRWYDGGSGSGDVADTREASVGGASGYGAGRRGEEEAQGGWQPDGAGRGRGRGRGEARGRGRGRGEARGRGRGERAPEGRRERMDNADAFQGRSSGMQAAADDDWSAGWADAFAFEGSGGPSSGAAGNLAGRDAGRDGGSGPGSNDDEFDVDAFLQEFRSEFMAGGDAATTGGSGAAASPDADWLSMLTNEADASAPGGSAGTTGGGGAAGDGDWLTALTAELDGPAAARNSRSTGAGGAPGGPDDGDWLSSLNAEPQAPAAGGQRGGQRQRRSTSQPRGGGAATGSAAGTDDFEDWLSQFDAPAGGGAVPAQGSVGGTPKGADEDVDWAAIFADAGVVSTEGAGPGSGAAGGGLAGDPLASWDAEGPARASEGAAPSGGSGSWAWREGSAGDDGVRWTTEMEGGDAAKSKGGGSK